MPNQSPARGATPSPQSVILAARAYKPPIAGTPGGQAANPPANRIVIPKKLSFWGNYDHGDCVTAEEAFAKSCNSPEIFISEKEVIAWATTNNVLNGAGLTQVMTMMQKDGFTGDGVNYGDGSYVSVDYKTATTLQHAITEGPVKLGIAADQLDATWQAAGGNEAGGKSGWFATGYHADTNEDHCVSLCGYGTISWLAQQLGVSVPSGVDGTKPGYALFTWDSIGIIDVPSMVNITAEAWLRQPVTVEKSGVRPPGLAPGGHGLIASWKGMTGDDRVFYAQFDGTNWSAQQQIVSIGSSAGPSLADFGGAVYAAWKGQGTDERLFYSSFNGSVWSTQKQIPGVASSTGPSLASPGNALHAVWKGMDLDESLWWASFNGTTWSAQKQIPGVASSTGPSLAAMNGVCYAAWKGQIGDQSLWWASFNGTTWSAQKQIPHVASDVGPSLAALNGTLYAAWKGELGDQTMWWATFNGTTWSAQKQIPGVASSEGPSLAVLKGTLYAIWKGENNDQSLWWATFNGTTWSAQKQIPGVGSGPDEPGLAI